MCNYGFQLATPDILNRLNVIHHTAIRLAIGVFRTVPIVDELCKVDYRHYTFKEKKQYLIC